MRVRLYTPDEASHRLGPEIVPPSWLREKARLREIPFVLIAGKYAFTDDHLEAIVRQFEVTPGDRPADRPTAAPRRRTPATPAPGVVQLRARPPRRAAANGTP